MPESASVEDPLEFFLMRLYRVMVCYGPLPRKPFLARIRFDAGHRPSPQCVQFGVLRHHEGLRKHNRSRQNCNGNITSSIESLHDSCSSSIATSCCIVLGNIILRPKKPSEKRKKDSVYSWRGFDSGYHINSNRARRCIARQSVHLLARDPHVIDGGDGRRCRSDLDDYRTIICLDCNTPTLEIPVIIGTVLR